jgi:multidrug resistance efflux pump
MSSISAIPFRGSSSALHEKDEAGRSREQVANDFQNEDLANATKTLPRWIREATLVRLLAILFTALLAAGFLPWRQTVAIPIAINASLPPISVPARETGTLIALQVKDGTSVAAGEPLGQIGNRAFIDQLARIEQYLSQVRGAIDRNQLPPVAPAISVGGDLQAAFDKLHKAIFDLRTSASLNVGDARAAVIQRDIAALEKRVQESAAGMSLRREVVALTRDRLARYQELASRGYVSQDRVSALRQQVLRDEIDGDNARLERIELRRQLVRMRGELAELLIENEVLNRDMLSDVKRSAEALAGTLQDRQFRSAVIAPVAGRVQFPRFHRAGDPVTSGQEFAVIVPNGGQLTAIGTIPPTARNDIRAGAEVRLEAGGYPSSYYGFLSGRVAAVSAVATKGAYAVRIDLPGEARTSRGVLLSLRSRTPGTGYITVNAGTIHSAIFGHIRGRLLST